MSSRKKMRKLSLILSVIILLIVALIIAFLFLIPRKNARDIKAVAELEANASPSDRPGLYVDGLALKHHDGTEVVMHGINHAHCWYRDKDDVAFKAIAEAGADTVRIVLACGIQWDADTADSVREAIEKAHSLGMLVIVEVHDGTGSDDIDVLKEIASFWCGIADVLKGTEDYVIVNIANEWVGKMNSRLWRDGYTTVIPVLREAGIKNVLMVDAAGWGQFGRCIDRYGVDVFRSDPCANTMFSVHMYGISGGLKSEIRNNLTSATHHGLCVCVGEFGYTHSDGNVNEQYLMKYCNEHNIGFLAWSWKGNSGGVEYLDLSLTWDGSELSPEWGAPFVEELDKHKP